MGRLRSIPTPVVGSRDETHLAVVVVSWNVCELLEQCLASIRRELEASPELAARIWVVDNASTDGSPAMVSHQFPDVELIANPDNRGFAAANNQALRAAGFDADTPTVDLPEYVILLNPDTSLQHGALRLWVDTARRYPHAGVIGTSLSYPDGSFQHSAFAFPTLSQILLDFYPLHHRLVHSRLNGRYPRSLYDAGAPFVIGHPLGASMLIQRPAIQDAGLFDEGYFIYAEEVDWCLRMRTAGWPALCAPGVRITHHEGRSTRQVNAPMLVRLWESRLRLFAKHYSPAFNWAARQLIRLGLVGLRRRALQQFAAGELNAAELAERRQAFDCVAALLRRPAEDFLP